MPREEQWYVTRHSKGSQVTSEYCGTWKIVYHTRAKQWDEQTANSLKYQ